MKQSIRDVAKNYQAATGEAPVDVMGAGQAVLVETRVSGEYNDHCPNGYQPILISRTPDGWVLFDTGQVPKSEAVPDGMMRNGSVLYIRTGRNDEEVQSGIRTLVNTLKKAREGLE